MEVKLLNIEDSIPSELPAAGENFENFWVSFGFGALFQPSGNAQWLQLNSLIQYLLFMKIWPKVMAGEIFGILSFC